MVRLFQSVALVQQPEGETSKLLLKWHAPELLDVYCRRSLKQRESFRESVTREVAWQLNLKRNSDFLVSNMAQLSIEYVETMPDETQRHIAVAFYIVHIYRRSLLESFLQDQSNESKTRV